MYLALRKGEKSDLAGDETERVTGVATSVASGYVALLTFWFQFLPLSRKAEPKETESHVRLQNSLHKGSGVQWVRLWALEVNRVEKGTLLWPG